MEKEGSGHTVQITTSLVDHGIAAVPAVVAALTKRGLNAATKSLEIDVSDRQSQRIRGIPTTDQVSDRGALGVEPPVAALHAKRRDVLSESRMREIRMSGSMRIRAGGAESARPSYSSPD
jgi:hypothetical protein